MLIYHFRFLLSRLIRLIFCNWSMFVFRLMTLICFYLSHLTEFRDWPRQGFRDLNHLFDIFAFRHV
jgi:hypothetical protein